MTLNTLLKLSLMFISYLIISLSTVILFMEFLNYSDNIAIISTIPKFNINSYLLNLIIEFVHNCILYLNTIPQFICLILSLILGFFLLISLLIYAYDLKPNISYFVLKGFLTSISASSIYFYIEYLLELSKQVSNDVIINLKFFKVIVKRSLEDHLQAFHNGLFDPINKNTILTLSEKLKLFEAGKVETKTYITVEKIKDFTTQNSFDKGLDYGNELVKAFINAKQLNSSYLSSVIDYLSAHSGLVLVIVTTIGCIGLLSYFNIINVTGVAVTKEYVNSAIQSAIDATGVTKEYVTTSIQSTFNNVFMAVNALSRNLIEIDETVHLLVRTLETFSQDMDRMRAMMTWLLLCEHARRNREPLPPFPNELR
jgi:hypothetical protein